MKEFFRKYRWKFFYWIVLVFMLFYFAPQQNKHYLDQDIKQFKSHYLIPALIWAVAILSVGMLIYWLFKKKSIKEAGMSFASVILSSAFIIFILQDIFLGIALFANRQMSRGSIIKTYQASFMVAGDNSKKRFTLYETSTKDLANDKKLINELYYEGLKQGDTITLTLSKGLLGVPFNRHRFGEK